MTVVLCTFVTYTLRITSTRSAPSTALDIRQYVTPLFACLMLFGTGGALCMCYAQGWVCQLALGSVSLVTQ